VNRAESTDVEAKISVAGWKPAGEAKVFELNGPDKLAANPFGSTEKVNIHDKSVTVKPGSMSYSFPAHSISILELSGN
jgi:alpha-L-arabinofuranosidase